MVGSSEEAGQLRVLGNDYSGLRLKAETVRSIFDTMPMRSGPAQRFDAMLMHGEQSPALFLFCVQAFGERGSR